MERGALIRHPSAGIRHPGASIWQPRADNRHLRTLARPRPRTSVLRPRTFVVVLGAAIVLSSCRASPDSSRRVVTASRPVGSWQGTGSKSVGDINSDTGRFHITWETRREQPPGQGTFKLTIRSAVSGRPLQVVVDHRGEGRGQAEFADAGRIYDFLVDSKNVEWSFTVEEIYEAYKRSP